MQNAHTDKTGNSYCYTCITTWVGQHNTSHFVCPATGETMSIDSFTLYKNLSLQSVIEVITSKNLHIDIKPKVDDAATDDAAADDAAANVDGYISDDDKGRDADEPLPVISPPKEERNLRPRPRKRRATPPL